MKVTREWLQLILTVGIMAFVIWFFLFYGPEQAKIAKEYWENPNFKTDSIQVGVDYSKLPTPVYKNYVPPKVVINYTPPEVHASISMNDSLITVIDSLKKELYTINALYLKLYPTNPKLIYGTFDTDSIRLDLLGIDGSIRTHLYGTNYERFRYQWKEGEFRAEPKKSSASKEFTSQSYAFGGYSLTDRAPMLGADYHLYKGKWRLGGNTYLTIEKQPTFNLQGTIGYRLYGTR